jgi:hypothetical protein
MKASRPPLPDCPQGRNPFLWIVRTAPMVREARRIIAERERQEQHYARTEDAKPAIRR